MLDPKKPLSKWTLDEMEELYAEQGSFRGCGRVVGVHHCTWIKAYDEKLKEKEQMKGLKQTLLTLDYMPKEKASPIVINSAVRLVQDNGYLCTKKPLQRGRTITIQPEPVDNNVYKIGLVSDTHLCSMYQQISSLWKFYETCEKQGVDTVLHSGDLSDGFKLYSGQEFEIFKHGEKAQSQYIVENYPHIEGIQTQVIGGNHDESFWKRFGTDICYNVGIQRPDISYLGFYLATVITHGVNICLHHGDGGVTYAKSYKSQKLALSKIENKEKPAPDVISLGHYHTSCILPRIFGMYMVQMPCFQGVTPNYMGRKGMNPDIGGVILELEIEDNKLVSTKTQYIQYKEQEDDY